MILEDLCLGRHEEARVPSNLSELGVSETVFDDGVNEAQGNWMILHFRVVEIVQKEGRYFVDDNSIIPTEERCGSLNGDSLLDLTRGEEIDTNKHELQENLLQLLSVGVDDLVFLECFQSTQRSTGNVVLGSLLWISLMTFDKVNLVGVDDAVILAADSEIVGNELNWALGSDLGFLRLVSERGAIVIASSTSAV